MATHPENTLTGYRAAIGAGARWVECDLQMTNDEQVVVLHDHQLSRTAELNKAIFDMSLAEAQQVSVHGASSTGRCVQRRDHGHPG